MLISVFNLNTGSEKIFLHSANKQVLTSEQTHICCSISFETAVFKFGFQNKSLTAQRTTVVSLENIAGSISVNTTLN